MSTCPGPPGWGAQFRQKTTTKAMKSLNTIPSSNTSLMTNLTTPSSLTIRPHQSLPSPLTVQPHHPSVARLTLPLNPSNALSFPTLLHSPNSRVKSANPCSISIVASKVLTSNLSSGSGLGSPANGKLLRSVV